MIIGHSACHHVWNFALILFTVLSLDASVFSNTSTLLKFPLFPHSFYQLAYQLALIISLSVRNFPSSIVIVWQWYTISHSDSRTIQILILHDRRQYMAGLYYKCVSGWRPFRWLCCFCCWWQVYNKYIDSQNKTKQTKTNLNATKNCRWKCVRLFLTSNRSFVPYCKPVKFEPIDLHFFGCKTTKCKQASSLFSLSKYIHTCL